MTDRTGNGSPRVVVITGAAAAVDREFGPVDVWVNNAMLSVFSPVKQMKPEEYRRVTEVTYLGYVYSWLPAAGSVAGLALTAPVANHRNNPR